MKYKPNNIGALFKNKIRTHERAPLMTGELQLTASVIRALGRRIANGERAILRLAAWRNTAANTAERYITLKAQLPLIEKSKNATLPFEDGEDPLDL